VNERERIERWHAKEDLIDEITAVFGLEQVGMRRALAILTHPSVVQHAIEFFKGLDDSHVCIKYEEPWNCASVAEMNYDSVKPHWLASEQTVVIGGDWCQPCREHALNKK
jgi:hypothetical protein